jgi:hypothetical protein
MKHSIIRPHQIVPASLCSARQMGNSRSGGLQCRQPTIALYGLRSERGRQLDFRGVRLAGASPYLDDAASVSRDAIVKIDVRRERLFGLSRHCLGPAKRNAGVLERSRGLGARSDRGAQCLASIGHRRDSQNFR